MTDSASTLTAVPVRVAAGDVVLNGDLNIPADARGLVVFSHGSGSSRAIESIHTKREPRSRCPIAPGRLM